jgi:hypothetical protein
MLDVLGNIPLLRGRISPMPWSRNLMAPSSPLQWAGLKEDGISVIRRLYAINTTTIRSHQGLTLEISI